MDISDIKRIIEHGESETLEFKKSTTQLKSAMQTICAFLNDKGGVVIFGVTNDKKIVGQNVTDNTKREISNTIKKFDPSIRLNVEFIKIEKNKEIIVIIAPDKKLNPPYVFDGRPCERVNSSTVVIKTEHYKHQIMEQRQKMHPWEDWESTKGTIDDLDDEEIFGTLADGIRFKRIPASEGEMNKKNILMKLKLLTNSGKITNAAMVLFGKDLENVYPQCTLRMSRFKGTDKHEFIDSQQVCCNAFCAIDEAMAFLSRHMVVSSRFIPGQTRREDVPVFPVLAVREAIINAIAHKDYSIYNGDIHLTMYDDRIEIISSGALPNGMNVDLLWRKHESKPRNEKISSVLYYRNLIEKWGRGTNEIIKLCEENGNPKPEFEEYHGSFVVKIIESTKLVKPAVRLQENKEELTARQETILN